MSKETNNPGIRQFEMLPPIQEDFIEFEGVRVQTGKGRWDFLGPEGELSSLDTYSIWAPGKWREIAERLRNGERCAMFIAGTYGVGQVFDAPEWQRTDDKYAEGAAIRRIKRRSIEQGFVAFVHPDDQIGIIDIDRLHPNFKHLRWAEARARAYGWAQHTVYPAKENGTIDLSILRPEDQTVACFWIPDHWGFEGLVDESRRITKHGIFGGSSLNIHGKDPSYSTNDLYVNFQQNPEWLDKIDFVIFDEISESCEIGRSQPMVSFAGDRPLLIRHGSLSLEEIRRRTGYDIEEAPEERLRFASSITEYNPENNLIIDRRVAQAEAMIRRFKSFKREPVSRGGFGAPRFSPVAH